MTKGLRYLTSVYKLKNGYKIYQVKGRCEYCGKEYMTESYVARSPEARPIKTVCAECNKIKWPCKYCSKKLYLSEMGSHEREHPIYVWYDGIGRKHETRN